MMKCSQGRARAWHLFILLVAVLVATALPSHQQMMTRRVVTTSQWDDGLLPMLARGNSNDMVQSECEGTDDTSPSPKTKITTPKPSTEKGTTKPKKGAPVVNTLPKGSVTVPKTLLFNTTHNGDATYYGGGGDACGYQDWKMPYGDVAIGDYVFKNGMGCGGCITEKRPDGTWTGPLIINNRCPECKEGVDHSVSAWKTLTSQNPTRFPVEWDWIQCGYSLMGLMGQIQSISGANYYDARFNVRQISGVIASLEVTLNGKPVPFEKRDFGSWVPVSADSHAILTQDSFDIILTNVNQERIVCPKLSVAILAKKPWIDCPTDGFQFTTT